MQVRVDDPGRAWPLVGREAELRQFASMLPDPRGKSLIVSGLAGVGKSRLAEECLARAAKAGYKTGRATASAAAGMVPLGAIAHLVPAGVDLSNPAAGFAAVANALEGNEKRRWVVLVDDLHLLDATSAMLLRQLVHSRVVRLIGTIRALEPVAKTVSALIHDDAMTHVDLTTLDQPQVARLLSRTLGGQVGRRTVHELYTGSSGNVLHLRELVLGGLKAGTLVNKGGVWEITPGSYASTPRLRELIETRLAAADPDARTVLEALALCAPLSLSDVEEIGPVDAVRQAGLVQLTADGRRTYLSLSHPLYGEILRASLPPLRRRALLLDQASRLHHHGARRRSDPLRVASWTLAATGTADPELLIQAAILARHAHDYEQVILFLQALPHSHHTAQSRLLLGEAYSSLQKFRDAEQILSEADQMARDESEKISVIQARSLSLLMHGHTEEALQVNEIGKNFTTSKLGKELLQINEGAIRCLSGEPAQGVRMLECLPKMREGIEAGVVADAWLWGVSAMNTGMVAIGRADDAIHFSTIAHELHAQLNNHTIFLHPIIHRVQLVIALTEAGRIPEARATMRESLARAEAEHEVVPYMLLSLWGGRLELIAGHVEQARRLYMEASVRAHAQNGVLAIRLADAGLAASASLLDDTAAAQAVMDRTPLSSGVGLFAGEDRLGEAWVHVSRGELAQARLVLTQAADTAKSSCHLVSEAMLLTDIARLGGAQDVTGRLEELAKRCDGSLTPARSRFVAALATKDPDRLVKSADELGKLGIDLLAAEAATTAAAIWRRLGQPRKATIATEHAETYSARCQGAHTPLLAPPEATAALTTREREIALLAVSGATSKDIASALGLSVRTVDNHLQHTYTKLGITTRRELVKALASRPSAAKKAGN